MSYNTQNNLLLDKLMEYYRRDNNLETMLKIINGESKISLRIVDWFATNYSKKYYTVYDLQKTGARFKVYNDYKLKLKAYSKKRFDPFCRWERITIPFKEGQCIQTTLGQLNFFKWALENEVVLYIEQNYVDIDNDMNQRNSTAKNKSLNYSVSSTSSTDTNASSSSYGSDASTTSSNNKTRKKREELSMNASRSIKKESVEVVLAFK